jgi:UDP-glucuronate 4-epimerase
MPPVLVTGAAGFIGAAVARRFIDEGHEVVGLDNLNAYYDPKLKAARLARLAGPAFRFEEADLADAGAITTLFDRHRFATVVHLAAQAGVRYSLENPGAYGASNLVGFLNILEACRIGGCRHLLYASSSSVYGMTTAMPFSVHGNVDHPVSLYAATKKANELMAHSYSHLYQLPVTGMRFFTVYGPWGRPDMAMFLFVKAMLEGRPIRVFNEGRMRRDFTYIDDIVEMVWRLAQHPPEPDASWDAASPDPATSRAPYRIYNLGHNQPAELGAVIAALERATGVTALRELLPMQPGDVPATYADIDDLVAAIGYRPQVGLEQGVTNFVRWYREYYGT